MRTRIVIPGFESLTQQQLFDMAVEHIGKTGVKSSDGAGCFYGGTGCNAAPFLTEKGRAIADKQEDTAWHYLVHEHQLVPDNNAEFICYLQECHDNALDEAFNLTYVRNMREMARQYRLDTTKLDALNWD